jgi:hypothetical protein
MPPDEEKMVKANPADYVKRRCPWCATEITYNVAGKSARECDILLLTLKDTCNGERFRDVRVYAAFHWIDSNRYFPVWAKIASLPPEELQAEIERRGARQREAAKKQPEKPDKYVRHYEELKRKGESFYQRMLEEEEKRYAPHTFTLAAEFEAIRLVLPEHNPAGQWSMKATEKAMRRALFFAQILEKCEVVLWGKARTRVVEAVEKFTPLVEAFDLARAEEKRRREEEEARRTAEHEERMATYRSKSPAYSAPISHPTPEDTAPSAASGDFMTEVGNLVPEHPIEETGRKRIEIPLIEGMEESQPQLPANDGRDPLYYRRLQYYRARGIWPDNRMLGVY